MSSAVNREIRKPNILHPCTPFNTDRNIALDRHIFFMRVKTLGCEKSGREIKHPEIACASRLLLSSPLAQQRLLSKPSLHLCVHTSVSIHIHMPFSGKPISSGVCTHKCIHSYTYAVQLKTHLVCVHTSVSIHIYAVQLNTHLVSHTSASIHPYIYIWCSAVQLMFSWKPICIHPYIYLCVCVCE